MSSEDIFYDELNYKCHIVARLKDLEEPQIVYRYYGKHKQWWHYCLISEYMFNSNFEIGYFKKKRPPSKAQP